MERASFDDFDGALWFGSVMWPDGRLLNDLFWNYYAPHIQEHDHGRALRALMTQTSAGMREFKSEAQFKARMREVFDPFLQVGKRARSRDGECVYCGRPKEQDRCNGCGAWHSQGVTT